MKLIEITKELVRTQEVVQLVTVDQIRASRLLVQPLTGLNPEAIVNTWVVIWQLSSKVLHHNGFPTFPLEVTGSA